MHGREGAPRAGPAPQIFAMQLDFLLHDANFREVTLLRRLAQVTAQGPGNVLLAPTNNLR